MHRQESSSIDANRREAGKRGSTQGSQTPLVVLRGSSTPATKILVLRSVDNLPSAVSVVKDVGNIVPVYRISSRTVQPTSWWNAISPLVMPLLLPLNLRQRHMEPPQCLRVHFRRLDCIFNWKIGGCRLLQSRTVYALPFAIKVGFLELDFLVLRDKEVFRILKRYDPPSV